MEKYLKYLENNQVSIHTYKQRKRYLLDIQRVCKKPLVNITPKDISKYLTYLNKKGLKGSSINTILFNLKAFYSWCIEEEYLHRSPISKNIKVREETKEMRLPQPEQIEVLLSLPKSPQNALILRLLLYTGVRVSELLQISKEDIYLISTTPYGYIELQGKGDKQRTVVFNGQVTEDIKKFIETIAGRLFNISSATVWNICRKYGKLAGINNFHPHLCRHYFATNFLSKGGDLRVLQMLLGHSSLATTERYLNYNFREMVDGYNKVFG